MEGEKKEKMRTNGLLQLVCDYVLHIREKASDLELVGSSNECWPSFMRERERVGIQSMTNERLKYIKSPKNFERRIYCIIILHNY